ncbi:MAG: sulfatase-like hydrolase/transferase [Proteobacteria bacterium]|nr:sulfatase-like hydrolase/transferase [Pseudomonadota bacterium]MCP4921015.1 sulfatase-like hydrolase/transferase [Pseudomonadota bacterium]
MNWLRDPARRWLRVVQLAVGIGFVAGGFEMVQIVSLLKLELTPGQGVSLGLLSLACGVLLAVTCALPVGVVVQLVLKKKLDSQAYAAGMAGTAFLVGGFFLWHASSDMWAQGRGWLPVAAMALCPVGVGGVVWFNAGYWGRREEIGSTSKLGWAGVSLLLGLGLVGVATMLASGKSYGSAKALSGDPNVLLVTIDTLRRDHVSTYDTNGSPALTPNLDALGERGIVYLDAVTPTPETTPAHASLMTTLHPLRHEVLSNAGQLSRGHVTLAERLEDEGYATAAFVSSFAVRGQTGLSQGFQLYDDDFAPVRGLTQILLVEYGIAGIMWSRQPQLVPWLLERDGDDTVALANDFIERQGDKPWFVWVHLFEPHAPYESDDATVDHRALLADPSHAYTDSQVAELRRVYAQEVQDADRLFGELVAKVDELGATDRTMVVVVADHGESLGEHDIQFHHHGLYEEVVQIPLIVSAPGLTIAEKRVPHQIRIMDIAPGVLRYIKLDPLEPTEGVDLLGYAQRVRKKSLVADLLGRETSALDAGCLLGLRAPSKLAPLEGQEPEDAGEGRVKYIVRPDDEQQEFFDLIADPREQENALELQSEAAAAALSRLRPSFQAGCGVLPGQSDLRALEALGYVEE